MTGFRVAPKAAYAQRGVCRHCGQPIVNARTGVFEARRSWHKECLREYNAARNPMYLRHLVWKRDHGRCAQCHAPSRLRWQADHIVEVADGGRSHLDNMQTLCIECHQAKTNVSANNRRNSRVSQV